MAILRSSGKLWAALSTTVFFLAAATLGNAQTFANIPGLSFTAVVNGANPLPQVMTVTSSPATAFSVTPSTTSGGNWLSTTPTGNGCCSTSEAITVSVNVASLAAGTYSGQLLIAQYFNGTPSMTVPVTLTVAAAGATYFGDVAGQASFSMTAGGTPPAQFIQIENGGGGSLHWTVTGSTADGGSWLSIPVASGAAPSMVKVGIVPSALPGAGAVAGAYIGQLVFKTTGGSVTVPVTVQVGNSVFTQVNPLYFTAPQGGGTLPQVLDIASNGTANFAFSSAVYTGTGGNWLTVSNGGGGCCATPEGITVSVNPGSLAPGVYIGEIVFLQYFQDSLALTVPVTLTVTAPSTTYFDSLPGELSFFRTTTETPAAQAIPIRNGGTGTLNWTASGITADGGKWLTLSAASGTAPSSLSVSIVTSALPGAGLTAGTYNGQVLLESGTDATTVPVTVTVGANVFTQVNPIEFTIVEGGEALPQLLTIASTGTQIAASAFVYTANGGNWLVASNTGGNCCGTPFTDTISVNAATLLPGVYSGEIVVLQYFEQTQAMTVPVTLTVVASGSSAYFDTLPGQMSFSLVTGGGAPAPQSIQIRNAGTGTLNWTLGVSTADGGKWLTASAASGTAPATVSFSINPSLLPSAGLAAGTYNGQIVLQTTGQEVTIPVSVMVGTSVLTQINAINFTMPEGGANPLPQIIAVSSTGSANIAFSASVFTASGGAWLALSNTGGGCCSTPEALTVSVNASTLPAGIYTGEITIVQYFQQNQNLTVPVTLTVAAPTVAFFDNLPGQLSFFMRTSGSAPSQTLQVRNAGSGTLNYTAKGSTADGGAWLTVTAAGGKAPSNVTVSVVTANLPGKGLTAGTFNGQVVLTATGDVVTVPVSVTVGPNVFNQLNGISFVMSQGGANPLPQILPVSGTGTAIAFSVTGYTGNGGNWLTVSTTGNGCCSTPNNITVGVNASTLTAGTYTGEITVAQYFQRNLLMTIPVTLTVVSCGPLFDNVPGLVSFSFAPSSGNPPSKTLQIRAAGAGTLNWTLTKATSDNGNWLTASAASGTAPNTVTVGVTTANLPGAGLVAGTYTGELVFSSASGSVSVPVSVTIGTSVFTQPAPLNFSMTLGGSNPAPQTVSVAAVGAAIAFTGTAYTGNGGAWFSISPKGSGCCSTPTTVTATVSATTLPAGTYTGEMTFVQYFQQSQAMTVPVTLTISAANTPAAIKATAGTPQTAVVAKAFATALAATVTDSGGSPVPGVVVTFNAPTSGASGTFACSANTAITNAAGVATAPVFTANDIAGKYSVTAKALTFTTSPGFALTNKAGAPASVTATAGTPQSAAVNTAFATQLAATVKDSFGNPVAGATVTFSAPASGASGIFAGGVHTATTNASGVATAPVFTANTVAGAYTVTAAVGSLTTSPGFSLTNTAGAAAAIVATAGTPQTATVNTAFATNLAATVSDTYGNLVSGATVTFTAPSSGAGGAFAGGVNTATTNASGVATAAVFTANTTAGSYTVTAAAGAVTTSPGFALTNQAGAAATIKTAGGTPQTATINTAFAQRLTASVKDSFGNPVAGVTVTFTAPASGASGTFAGGVNTAKTSATGVATAPVFTANGTVGSYTVTAKVGTLVTSPGFALTNQN